MLRAVLNTTLLCLFFGVAAQNWALLGQNHRLKTTLDQAGSYVDPRLANLSGLDSSGKIEHISLPTDDAHHLLIITFAPGCPACRANLDMWRDLATSLRDRPDWRIVWLSRDSVEPTFEYAEENVIDLGNVFADPPYRTYRQLGMGSVPSTIVVGQDGEVQQDWSGQFDREAWVKVTNYFRRAKSISSASASPSH